MSKFPCDSGFTYDLHIYTKQLVRGFFMSLPDFDKNMAYVEVSRSSSGKYICILVDGSNRHKAAMYVFPWMPRFLAFRLGVPLICVGSAQ